MLASLSTSFPRSTSCPAQLCSSRASSLLQPMSSLSAVSSLTTVQSSLPKLRTCAAVPTALTAESEDREDAEDAKSAEYSDTMQQRMGGYLTYCHEDGINYANILDDIMVGSCLQTPEDVDRCVKPCSTALRAPDFQGFHALAFMQSCGGRCEEHEYTAQMHRAVPVPVHVMGEIRQSSEVLNACTLLRLSRTCPPACKPSPSLVIMCMQAGT